MTGDRHLMRYDSDPLVDVDCVALNNYSYLDHFEIDLDFCLSDFQPLRSSRVDDESSENLESKQAHKRMRLRLPKHDIRRYYSNMFLNAINSANFDYILPYFCNFMNPSGRFVLEYTAPNQPKVRAMNMVAEGAQATAYYLLGLGVMFPDMSIQATSGQVVTSNAWAGCKIVLETTFNYTKIYNISFEKALAQLSRAYQPYKDRAMLDEARVERTLGQTDCEAARLTLSSRSTSSTMSASSECDSVFSTTQSSAANPSADAMKVAGPAPAPHMILTTKVHEVFARQETLAVPLKISARCRFVILLDERNHMNQITVSAVQEGAKPVSPFSLNTSAL